ncbi:hypothetical protein DFAR_3220011 [Desulfarculales bacterium]
MPNFTSPRAWPLIYRPCARPCSNGDYHSSSTSTTVQPSIPTTWKRLLPPWGIALVHSQPIRAPGQGRDRKILPHRQIPVSPGLKGYTLRDMNEALERWVRGAYHQRKHLGTGQAPL